jgi:hypothetical protein
VFSFGGEEHAAVPLWQSIPVALAILAVWLAVPTSIWRTEQRDRRESGATDGSSGSSLDGALAAACMVVAVLLAIVPLGMVGGVAFGYATPNTDAIGWGVAAAWTALFGSVLWAFAGLVARLAVGCWRGVPAARVAGGVLAALALVVFLNVA